MPTVHRPAEGEFAPFYAGYISKVKGDDVLPELHRQLVETAAFIRNFPVDRQDFRYAEGKWTPREVFLHILDAERVFAYRALRFARGDANALSGFEQNDYVPESNADARSLESIAGEYEAVRKATIYLLESLTEAQTQRSGPANNREVSVRALAFIIAGHETHHVAILRERYLV